MENFETA